MADDKTTKTPEQPVTDSGPGKETPPAPPKEPEKVSVSPEPEKKTEPEVKNPQVSVYNFAEIMKEKKAEERAAAPGVEKPDPAKTEKPEKQPEAPKKAEEKPKEPEQPKRRGRPPKADKDKAAAPKSKAPAQKPEKTVKKEPEKKTAPTVQTAPTPKKPEKPQDAPRRGKEQINASRLFSCLYGQPLAVGRVMTPVLAMTVVREAAIAAFVPEKFYTVDLELTSGCTASSRRIPEKSVAEKLLEACRREMVATIQRITRKEKSENPPLLYDLTTLQRDANRLLGYSAQQTLDYVQSLYEKKLTTYPRTDSCYITDDDEEMLEELTEELEGFLGITPEDMDEAVPRTRRTVNREKVTDHHAILPTRSMLQADLDALPKGEQNVLKLIIARTLMAVSKPFRYLETLLTTECAGEEFTAKGKEVLEEGWKAVERKVLADILNRKQELTALPNAAENECGILNAELKEGQTSPPKHFTDVICYHCG